jgi:hypothetical protein
VNGALFGSPAINRRAVRQASALVLYMSRLLIHCGLILNSEMAFDFNTAEPAK